MSVWVWRSKNTVLLLSSLNTGCSPSFTWSSLKTALPMSLPASGGQLECKESQSKFLSARWQGQKVSAGYGLWMVFGDLHHCLVWPWKQVQLVSLHWMEKSKSLHCSHHSRKLLTKIFVKISNIVVSVVEKSFQTVKKYIKFSNMHKNADNLYDIFC